VLTEKFLILEHLFPSGLQIKFYKLALKTGVATFNPGPIQSRCLPIGKRAKFQAGDSLVRMKV
jgi:hypothetical protein